MNGKKLLALVLLGVFLTVSYMVATAEDAKDTYTLEGVKNCKMCHNKEATGAQYAKWEESSHAKAYETLAGEKAMAIGKEMGIENPQTSDKCLPCHATAYPVMAKVADMKITMEEGVSCESCHGPGSGYKSLKTMKGLYDGSIEPASVGLWTPDEKVCVTCHKKEGNPTFESFDYAEYVKKIAHPIPKGE